MARVRTRPINKKRLFIRVYVSLMSVILAASLMALLTQSVTARTAQDVPAAVSQEADRVRSASPPESVTVHYRGQTMKTSAQAETAGELLDRLGLEVSGEDMVSCGLTQPVHGGMEITVDRLESRQETSAVTIPHETTLCTDQTLAAGASQVLLEGADGELMCTDRVTYKNGVEVSRTTLAETVTKQPVTELVSVGAAQAQDTDALQIGDGYIRLPTGETLTYTHTAVIRATGYTQTDPGCDGLTATGTNVRRGIVAVDPRYIPYGTRMFIRTVSGSYVYGIAVAEDCGGDIKGDRMDLYFPTYEEAREFGRRVCTVYFLG